MVSAILAAAVSGSVQSTGSSGKGAPRGRCGADLTGAVVLPPRPNARTRLAALQVNSDALAIDHHTARSEVCALNGTVHACRTRNVWREAQHDNGKGPS